MGIRIYGLQVYIMLFSIGVVVSPPPNKVPPAYSKELETDLRQWLFGSYEVLQRPQKRNDVKISLNLLSLNYLDIKEQKLSITAYFTFVWFDSRLTWFMNSTYSNIKFMFSNEIQVWKPPIIIENSVDDIDVITRPSVPMRIISNGRIIWLPAGIFTTHCESSVTYWPLDTQTCEIILSSWSYTAKEVLLKFDDRQIVTSFYQDNGEWELISTEYSSIVTKREFESFSRLIFSLTFRRRPLFHMLNTLFPVVLMGFLTVAIFKLSPESGERVGLALTILLAYAVYLSLISESIPQTSLSASLLSTYLASILFLQTLSVLLTVIYIDVYFTPDTTPVPKWVQSVTSSCLSKLACVDCGRTTTKVFPKNMDMNKEKKIASVEDYDTEINEAWAYDEDEEEFGKQYSWKEIALLLDRVTMYIYLVLVTGFTVASMGVMLHHYHTAY
ncbi:neuronal acetylcholine receptor subunit alpha-3-like [Mercenaria mercenaria]|uniref:neuronal acetylcholine receptor subunit alpha-3-like n=1 Tax=Mercenaria mercenaria TaxID=6596 RepID=UPI00234EA814|nr:neuronal acetylcholine receptor subunit alpha-3-like [Mercenaria mercenaria]